MCCSASPVTRELQFARLLPDELIPVGAEPYFPRMYDFDATAENFTDVEFVFAEVFLCNDYDLTEVQTAAALLIARMMGQSWSDETPRLGGGLPR